MSEGKIKRRNFSKTLLEAADGPLIEEGLPPAELYDSAQSLANDALLRTTIDGQECHLPFEVLEEIPAVVPHLDESGISRMPFRCPVGGCTHTCSLLLFSMHISYDHTNVLLENLWPSETNTVLVDPSVPEDSPGLPQCHKLYLVSGKIRYSWNQQGFGDGKHRDKLPFALMSAKFSLHGTERMVLWITGPDAGDDRRQRYTMEAGRNDPKRLLPYAVAFSGEIVSLHSSQDGEEIHRSGAGLIIPEQQIDSLVDRRTKLLEVCIHFH